MNFRGKYEDYLYTRYVKSTLWDFANFIGVMINFLAILFLLISYEASANLEAVRSNKPLYEFGVVGGAAVVPDYPGSDESRFRYLVFPQIRYRGFRFRSDEEDSLKARLFLNPLYGIDLGGSGSFNANKNEARKGMKDLDWVGELGPRFYFFFVRTNKVWLRFFLPLRVAASSDLSSLTYQGLVVAPSLSLRYYFDDSKFNSVIAGVTRTHTTHQLQEFYYDVDQKYATPERAAYKSTSGYMGTSTSLAYIYERDHTGIYVGLGLSSFVGAANAGSPLHKADYAFAGFAGFSYLFYQSEERGYQ